MRRLTVMMDERSLPRTLSGVREYTEEYPVELVNHRGRLCVRAVNEGGNNETLVDVWDVIEQALPNVFDMLRTAEHQTVVWMTSKQADDLLDAESENAALRARIKRLRQVVVVAAILDKVRWSSAAIGGLSQALAQIEPSDLDPPQAASERGTGEQP